MNDPDRWHTSDRFDDDAVFADIIAHMNDDAPEFEKKARPPADGATADNGTTERSTDDATVEETDEEDDATVDETVDETEDATDGQDLWQVNQPAVLPQPDDPLILPTPQVWRAHEVDDTYEEHFEPPPTAPLPVGDLQFWGIIAGMGGGPLLLLYLVFFNRDAGSYWLLTAIAMSVGGFALLVSRLPRHHEDDDDGARL